MSTVAGTPMYRWKSIPWKKLHRSVFKLQKRIYQANGRPTSTSPSVRMTSVNKSRSRMMGNYHVRFCSRAAGVTPPLRLTSGHSSIHSADFGPSRALPFPIGPILNRNDVTAVPRLLNSRRTAAVEQQPSNSRRTSVETPPASTLLPALLFRCLTALGQAAHAACLA
jgi:hypothetical protein